MIACRLGLWLSWIACASFSALSCHGSWLRGQEWQPWSWVLLRLVEHRTSPRTLGRSSRALWTVRRRRHRIPWFPWPHPFSLGVCYGVHRGRRLFVAQQHRHAKKGEWTKDRAGRQARHCPRGAAGASPDHIVPFRAGFGTLSGSGDSDRLPCGHRASALAHS